MGAAVVAVLMAAALFGTSGTARALLVPESWPPGVAAVRLLVGALGLLVFVRVTQGTLNAVRALWRRPGIWVAGAAVAGYQGLFFMGVDRTGVAIGTLVSLGLAPLLAGLLGWALGEGPPGWSWVLFTTVAVAGLSLLTLGGTSGADPLGVLAALGAGCCYAAYTVLGAREARAGADAGAVMAAAFALGAVVLLPFLPAAVQWLWSPAGLCLAVWLGIAATTVAYLLFGSALPVLQPGHIATLNLFEPVVATLLGVTLLGETLTGSAWLGCLLVMLSLVGLGLGERRATAEGLPDPDVDDTSGPRPAT